ncbi:unnamed protein product [Discosporangium mesarthrocarpum]
MKVYVQTKKSETPSYLCQYLEDLAKPANVRLQVLRTDSGGKFTSHILKDVCSRHSIQHQFTAPYSPHQIGVAEREWRTLMAMTRCFLSVPGVPKAFCGLRLSRLLCTYETGFQVPSYGDELPLKFERAEFPLHHLKVLGAVAFVHVETHKTKLLQKG